MTEPESKPAPEPKTKNHREKERIDKVLNGKDYEQSLAGRELLRLYGKFSAKELLSVATLVSEATRITINRNEKRSRSVLIKWFNDHWDVIQPHVEKLRFLDSDKKVIVPPEEDESNDQSLISL